MLNAGFHQPLRQPLRIAAAAAADVGCIVVVELPLLPSMLTSIHFVDASPLAVPLLTYSLHQPIAPAMDCMDDGYYYHLDLDADLFVNIAAAAAVTSMI